MNVIAARVLLNSRILRRINTAVTRSRIWWSTRKENRRRRREPSNLMNFEKRIYSQNGEDGILLEIFKRIGATNRSFLEIGVGFRPGTRSAECNTRNLLENHGWSGIWMDAGEDFARYAARDFARFPLKMACEFVVRETIVERLKALGVKPELDLMSIDIDGNDYWIWQELAVFRPRVVILEYNGAFTPGTDWVMSYDPQHAWDTTYYFGASLDAYVRLSEQLGYSLVGCDSNGVNAFFVRKDLVGNHFTPGDARKHYAAPKHNPHFYGFPPSADKRIAASRGAR